ncbi:MAG: hypothetical protein LC777_13905 [Actinobacteria bacterium]|nr:hypothetical protein [Actinomycetota bacterium]
MAYELLWTDHADVVGTYGSRSEAEADLLAYATEHPKDADEIAVIEIDDQGHRVGDFLSGAELLRRQPA